MTKEIPHGFLKIARDSVIVSEVLRREGLIEPTSPTPIACIADEMSHRIWPASPLPLSALLGPNIKSIAGEVLRHLEPTKSMVRSSADLAALSPSRLRAFAKRLRDEYGIGLEEYGVRLDSQGGRLGMAKDNPATLRRLAAYLECQDDGIDAIHAEALLINARLNEAKLEGDRAKARADFDAWLKDKISQMKVTKCRGVD